MANVRRPASCTRCVRMGHKRMLGLLCLLSHWFRLIDCGFSRIDHHLGNPDPLRVTTSAIHSFLEHNSRPNHHLPLQDVLGASPVHGPPMMAGDSVMHYAMNICSSTLMLSDAMPGMPEPVPARAYVYVPDVDAVCKKASESGMLPCCAYHSLPPSDRNRSWIGFVGAAGSYTIEQSMLLITTHGT